MNESIFNSEEEKNEAGSKIRDPSQVEIDRLREELDRKTSLLNKQGSALKEEKQMREFAE